MPISCFYGTPSPPPAPFSPSTRYFSGHQPQPSDFNTEFRRLSDTCRGPTCADRPKVNDSERLSRLFQPAWWPHPHPSHSLRWLFCRRRVCLLRSRHAVKSTSPTPYHPRAHSPPNTLSPPMATGGESRDPHPRSLTARTPPTPSPSPDAGPHRSDGHNAGSSSPGHVPTPCRWYRD